MTLLGRAALFVIHFCALLVLEFLSLIAAALAYLSVLPTLLWAQPPNPVSTLEDATRQYGVLGGFVGIVVLSMSGVIIHLYADLKRERQARTEEEKKRYEEMRDDMKSLQQALQGLGASFAAMAEATGRRLK